MIELALFVLPLGLDTFAVSAALGISLPPERRLRISLVMSAFEVAMPVIGLVAGRGLGHVLGGVSEYVAAGLLFLVAVYMLVSDEGEVGRADVSGLALVALGISVSLDELAIGISFGLADVSLVAALVVIGVQAFVAAQLGLRLGARVGAAARERAEQVAAVALIALGALIVAEQLS